MLRGVALAAGLLAAAPAIAGEMSADEARRFVMGKMFNYTCFEGTRGQGNGLIEDGILVGYLQDRMNARLMGVAPTGNGRRESYAYHPMPRMTNTYMLAGDKSPEELIRSVKRGVYAVNFGGGQVDITSGKFVFSASEAFWVENGKILYPVKGATIVGNGPDARTRVTMMGNDMQLDSGGGPGGKEGKSVQDGGGRPELRSAGRHVGDLAGWFRDDNVADAASRPW